MMTDAHTIVLTYHNGRREKIKTEGLERANQIVRSLLYRVRCNRTIYYHIAIYNHNGDMVSIPYRSREDAVVR